MIDQVFLQVPQFFPKVFAGIFIMLVFWILGVLIPGVTLYLGRKAHIHKDIITLLGRIAQTGLIILGIISGLGTMGINVSALVASLGLTGFALGFALKDALSNVLAGILILIYRPFLCGDKIKTCGYEGCVIKIDLRYTTLKSINQSILIPNSNLFNHPIVIWEQEECGEEPH